MHHTHHLEFADDQVTKRFVSWDRGESEREWATLTLLAEHCPGLAPTPLTRGSLEGSPFIVMTELAGDALDSPMTQVQLDSWATGMQQLFSIPPAAVIAAHPHERIHGPDVIAAEVSGWMSQTFDLCTCLDPVLVGDAIAAARAYLREPPMHGGHVPPVLGRSDGCAANMLWDGERCLMLDFEDSGTSDPAFEVADFVEHLMVWPTLGADAHDLARAVGTRASDLGRVDHFRRVLACFWLFVLLPGSRGSHRNPRGTLERQATHCLALLGR